MATPSFDFFLARDRIAGVIIAFVIDEPINLVTFRETAALIVGVKPKATLKTVRHAGVENGPTSIRHHVNIVGLHLDGEVPRSARDDTLGKLSRSIAALSLGMATNAPCEGSIWPPQ